jgi:DNA-binding response OmpR family regulator
LGSSSGYINADVKKDTTNLGINRYLGKPFNGIELLQAVVSVLDS